MKRLTPAAVTLMTVVVFVLLVTAYFAKMLMAEEPKARLLDEPKTAPALVEYREIPLTLSPLEPGTQLTAALLGTGRVPVNALEPETLLSEKGLVGRIVKETIPAGRPIRSSQLYPPGERPPLAVSPGMRAVSVSFSPRGSFVGGLLQKGQYVDIYLTPRLDSNQSESSRLRDGVTITLLTGVRVLAVGENSEIESAKAESAKTVTLELTPEQANILILAHERGEIALSYNPDGKGTGGVAVKSQDRATMDELLGLNRQEPVPPPAKALTSRQFTSETFKGTKKSTLRFDPAASTDSGNQP
jgi:pilus assembly protein CpaB